MKIKKRNYADKETKSCQTQMEKEKSEWMKI